MEYKDCLVILSVYPEKKKIKPRLTRDLDPELVSELFYLFVPEVIDRFKYGEYDFKLCFYPEHYRDSFIKWLGGEIDLIPQSGRKMNEKIKNCFETLFEMGYERVIVLTSDTPDLPYLTVEKGFLALDNNDAVIGPSTDNSFYMLGLNKSIYRPEIFEDVAVGTGIEFLTIYNRIKDRSVLVMPKRNNIDVVEDIQIFMNAENRNMPSNSPTIQFLEKNREHLMKLSSINASH